MNKAKNMTTGAGYLLRREDYKRVKKMDRQQFESFCKNLYMTAYEEGRKSVPGIDIHLRISVVRSGSAGMWQHKKMCRRKLRADRRSHGE